MTVLFRLQKFRFQSTLLVRGATFLKNGFTHLLKFQSTLLVRGATFKWGRDIQSFFISIHAPRERSDHERTKI